MKNSIFRILICLVVFVGSKELSAQSADPNVSDYTKIVDILPPSPNAASLGKFGGLNTNLSSGMINTGIPVYEYRSTNITVPVSLHYSSNGTRVDEISGRVGTGWSLEAGGVITRTVMGRPDDHAQRTIPTGFSSRSDMDLIDAICVGDGGVDDAQPDLFSFNINGNSGKFILDSSFNPVLLTHSGLKIESAFDVNSMLTFRITTVDGVQYCFDSDSAMETTEKKVEDCGRNVPQFIVTAWYLSRIIHPNHDTVSFSYSPIGSDYKLGIYQSIFQVNSEYTPPVCSFYTNIPVPQIQNSTCLSWLMTAGQRLTAIHSTGGASIQLEYGQRIDLSDGLLTSIKVYQPGADNPCRVFTFQYQQIKANSFINTYSSSDSTLKYRPFLTAFSEESPDSAIRKNYSFSYNDPGGLAPRLSYAQDDYGFFNGKNNNTMIPQPADLIWRQALPSATANRGSDAFYASKGMLTKIVYPTGGQDSIVYESNTVYVNQPIYEPPISEILTAESDQLGPPVTDTSSVFHVYFDQQTELFANCLLLPGNTADPIHDKATVSLVDKTSGVQVFTQTLGTGGNAAEPLSLDGGHDYQLKITVTGTGVSGAINLQYIPDTAITHLVNKPVGGVRVQKLITQSDPSAVPSIKHFFYNRPDDTASSGSYIQQPIYQKPLFAYAACKTGDCGCESPPFSCQYTNFYYYSMYSNSLNTIYLYSGTPVCYSNVTESSGDNFENGGIRHDFFINPDNLSSPILGDIILGAPLTSFDLISGKETYQCIFRNQSGTFVPVKKIYTHYNDDSTVDSAYPAFITNKKYSPLCIDNPPDEIEREAYDVSEYLIYRKWIYADSVRTLTYDGSGANYIEEDLATQYANKTHALPTAISRNLSDTRTEIIHNYYPSDLTLSGDAETARQNMISQHILSPVLKLQVSRGGAQTFLVNNNYHVFGNGLVLPSNYVVQTFGNTPEERVDFTRYNAAGKISEQYKTNDQKQADIWDYHYMYLIALVTNADSASVAFTSFEADGNGNWSFSGSVTTDPGSPAGNNCYAVSQGISKSGLSSSNTYIVSYWEKSGATVTVTGSVSSTQGKTINGWTYMEQKVSGVSTVSLSGSGYIDELRLYPVDAQMTSYTYSPLVGVTTSDDAAGRITYYQYDGLGRLSVVKDQDGNIIKTMQYHYKGQTAP